MGADVAKPLAHDAAPHGVPVGTGPQVPSEPDPLSAAVHAMHIPVQGWLQQTPPEQTPLVH